MNISISRNVKTTLQTLATGLRSWLWAIGRGSSILDFRYWVLIHSVVFTRCDKKLLQSVTAIKIVRENYNNMWQVFPSVLAIPKWDFTVCPWRWCKTREKTMIHITALIQFLRKVKFVTEVNWYIQHCLGIPHRRDTMEQDKFKDTNLFHILHHFTRQSCLCTNVLLKW